MSGGEKLPTTKGFGEGRPEIEMKKVLIKLGHRVITKEAKPFGEGDSLS